MLRDRLTFAMMVGIPIMQLLMFGYAINADPRALPTAVVVADTGTYARSIVAALENSGYFRVVAWPAGPRDAEALLARGDVQFTLEIPIDFSRRLLRGERPAILVEADASDPVATGNALAALSRLNETALAHDLTGPLGSLAAQAPPFEVRIHRRYNPEGATEFNIVPGLMGTILTMTLGMMTAVAVTREFERGTMENLLATPVRPLEVMLGKIIPYVFVGLVQAGVILGAGALLFSVPMLGSLGLLILCVFVFVAANLAVGFTFSTLARSQMQAMQMSLFFFLPSMLLSGFLFPFRGMPDWAQVLGELLPLTHFLRIVRGILLKGSTWPDVWPSLWPIVLFLLAAAAIALRRYRQTLD
ncbi:MAG: ABC transporter permease [Rhodospirillaceae bacterium]|nr:ABC transporter permease [Rhodospirillaceae bacterium]